MAVLRGKAWVFGDNIDTDLIYHGKYLPITDPEEMAKHAMEYVPGMENFAKEVKPGDLVVAGRNFGSGSSREHAVLCLKYLKVAGVIAESISRIYYRNAVNNGFMILECPDVTKKVKTGDELEVEPETGRIKNLTTGEEFYAHPVSGLEKEIMEKGGLIEYIKSQMGR
ncbi:MAG: 3-isopropylmalate dehydratase small subunit [Synergistetes bacterium]|nr:3-isopropylmalate dehydratase small subunit [Synergistota bacterium]